MTAATRTVDAHLHLWDPALGVYDWLTPDLGLLHARFGPEDARPELDRAGVTSAVLVQAADSPLDTEALLAIAGKHAWVAGVVGWLDLEDPDGVDAELERLAHVPGGHRLCGVRQLIHDDARADVLALPAVSRTAARLAAHGIPLDVPDAFPRQLDGATELASRHTQLAVVVDHLAKPPRGTDAMGEWERALRAIAGHDNVMAKVSGLHVAGQPHTADALRPVLDVALDAFGSSRLILGSDWPISLLGGDYRATMGILDSLIDELSRDEQDDLRWRTANRVYSLDNEKD